MSAQQFLVFLLREGPGGEGHEIESVNVLWSKRQRFAKLLECRKQFPLCQLGAAEYYDQAHVQRALLEVGRRQLFRPGIVSLIKRPGTLAHCRRLGKRNCRHAAGKTEDTGQLGKPATEVRTLIECQRGGPSPFVAFPGFSLHPVSATLHRTWPELLAAGLSCVYIS